jgi:hypothetical protein
VQQKEETKTRDTEREREGMWMFENYGKLWTDCLVPSFFAAKRAN